VLLKRIRVALGGLVGGFLPRDTASALAVSAKEADIADQIKRAVDDHLRTKATGLSIDKVVDEQRARLTTEWTSLNARARLAPGEEILTAIFHRVGGEYAKPMDTERIAAEMTSEEIPGEIKVDIIERIVAATR
jgi:hypothetical protein